MTCLCLANISWATVCANSTGVAEDEHYDLSNIFNSTNNQPGQIVVLPEKSGWVGVSAICPPGTLVNYTYRSYVTNFIVQETGNDSNLLIVFYVQIIPDDFVMQLHRF